MSLIIREATQADAAGIAKVHVITWQHAYRGQLPEEYLDSLSIEDRQRRWETLLSDDQRPSSIWVAVEQGSVIGFCSVGPSRDENSGSRHGELYAIYVLPDKMANGVGSALMRAGLHWLVEQGCEQATLWVLTSNEQARKFYERKGWVADGMTKVKQDSQRTLHESRYALML